LSSQTEGDTAGVLQGQIAIVTGGGRGLGRAFAQALAAAGASVAVLARSAEELAETVATIEGHGGRAVSFPVDITDERAVQGAFAEIDRLFGPVDLLVNNAAMMGPIAPFLETPVADWWRVMDVNLRGPLLAISAVLPGMVARRRGRIINVVTAAAPLAYLSSYITSKTALVRATECMASELRPHGIALFSLAPGTVRTAMSENSLYSDAGRKWIPWYQKIFEEGLDLPPERPTGLMVTLASGKADLLSGLYLTPFDDLDRLLQSIAEIEKDKLYSLRVKSLSTSASAAAMNAIRNLAERPVE
jgi:NAD(P)-dependent dehydrogenase (short-subunit alcohol dehydrogenase family)